MCICPKTELIREPVGTFWGLSNLANGDNIKETGRTGGNRYARI